jgi:hypothetical protein
MNVELSFIFLKKSELMQTSYAVQAQDAEIEIN